MQLDFVRAANAGVELGEAERAALVALVIGNYQPLGRRTEESDRRIPRDPDATPLGNPIAMALAEIDERHYEGLSTVIGLGLVVVWAGDDGAEFVRGPALTLSAWGAHVLSVEPVELVDGYPHWGEAEDPEAKVSRWGGVRMPPDPFGRSYGMTLPELMEDPRPSGEPDYVKDEWSGQPLHVLGVPVEVDRRARARGKKGRRRAG